MIAASSIAFGISFVGTIMANQLDLMTKKRGEEKKD